MLITPWLIALALAQPHPRPPAARAVAPTTTKTTPSAAPRGSLQADAARAQQILAGLQRAYRSRSFAAQFSQAYTDAILGPRPAEQGRLQAAGDGRVRFDYLTPTAKTFVYDGHTAYFFEPEAAQVTVIEHFASGPLATTMGFLWGQGTLGSDFSATVCRHNCPTLGPGEAALVLTPKRPMPGVLRVVLVVHEASHEVSRTVLSDPLHNLTEYTLTQRQLGAPIADHLFTFVIPEGLSVLRTTPDGAMPGPSPEEL